MLAAQLLDRDVAQTLGERHRKIVRFEVGVVAMLDRSDLDDVLVEHVQQSVHHTVNSTWPACPRHTKHPLWYQDGARWERWSVAARRVTVLAWGILFALLIGVLFRVDVFV
jgi:hypothetical protein